MENNITRVMRGTVPGITPKESVQLVINKIKNDFFDITSDKIFLDVGSGIGSVVDDFRKISNIEKSIGVEMQKIYFDKAIELYPESHYYNDLIQNKLDIVEEADIIFTNNICFPDETFWDIFPSIKPGALVIYNNIALTSKLIYNHGYLRSDIHKIMIISNNMTSEYHLFIK